MDRIRSVISNMDKNDKLMFTQIIASAAVTIAVWWYFSGRRKYSTKGMH